VTVDLTTLLPLVAALAAAGAAAGLIAGLLGVGGGIVTVPVLFQVFELMGIDPSVRMHLAVGTSLAAIVPTALTSMRHHYRAGAVDNAVVRSWAPSVAVGVLIGAGLAGLAKGAVLTAVFAVVALAVALYMLFSREGVTVREQLPTGPARHLIASLIGGFSAMMGIGGGSLSVPVMVLCSMPIRRAVATASALGLIIAVPGALGFIVTGLGVEHRPPWSLGFVSLLALFLIMPTSMLTAPWGARIAHRIAPSLLRRAFALFLMATSARMFYALL